MSVDGISGGSERVIAALRHASVRTGVDFDYLLGQARIESGLDPHASATTGSAEGLFQFTAATWRATVARHGAAHGIAAIDARRDPHAAALMAGALAVDNAAALTRGLGRRPGPTDLYLAHFLGGSGAVRFLRARDAAPETSAAAIMPAAAAGNRAVFFAPGGEPRSLAEVYDRFAARFDGNPVPPTGTAVPVAPEVQAVRFAYLLLAELGA